MAKVRRPTEPRGRLRWLDDGERVRLLAACREANDPRLYALAVLALTTAARQGELLALRWRDVDLGRGMAVLEETKNGDRRSLALRGEALDLMRERSRVRRLDTDLVFADELGRATFPEKEWRAAVKRAGVDSFRWHDLRHTAASYAAMSGATLAELAGLLGHKTLAMVKRYAHLSEQHVAGVVERVVERAGLGGGAP